MENTIQFIGVSPSDFIENLKEQLVPELEARLAEQFIPKKPIEYLTRNEVCDLLQIDLSTLHRWRVNGTLIGYGLGNRVYFKRSEIEAFLENNKLTK